MLRELLTIIAGGGAGILKCFSAHPQKHEQIYARPYCVVMLAHILEVELSKNVWSPKFSKIFHAPHFNPAAIIVLKQLLDI